MGSRVLSWFGSIQDLLSGDVVGGSKFVVWVVMDLTNRTRESYCLAKALIYNFLSPSPRLHFSWSVIGLKLLPILSCQLSTGARSDSCTIVM